MSEIRDILEAVISERAATFGDTMTHPSLGNITVEIQAIQDIELNAELGRDARETVTFHVADRDKAAQIKLNDVVIALGQQFRILRRSDNPLTIQVEFGAMKVTDNDL